MNEDLKRLYHELGYTGQLGKTKMPRGEEPQPEIAEPGLPPLDPQNLEIIEKLLKDQSQETLSAVRENLEGDLTDDQIRETFSEARRAFDDPAKFLSDLESKRSAEKEDLPSPGKKPRGDSQPAPLDELLGQFRQYPDIVVDPSRTKFEPVADALGWAFNTGLYWFRDKLNISYKKARFLYHDEFDSYFKYKMKNKDGAELGPDQKISVALFADWGTGLYHSKFITKHIEELKPDYAIHLGDVYYAGRSSEFEDNMRKPMSPILQHSRFFNMNANHEMFSGDFPYFRYLKDKRESNSGVEQEQEGSYFCLWNEKYQVIGIDTAYHEDGRHKNITLKNWLGERLSQGKEANPKRTNILLSPNDPYRLGVEKPSGLLTSDMQTFAEQGLIDFWFWGNTHYAALFDKSDETPFIGSCIGHGGHPVYKKKIMDRKEEHDDLVAKNNKVPPALWVELTPRFPEIINLRQDIGNNGWCMLELEPDAVRLTYYDWLKNCRFTIDFPV